jgi:hypothetical protein
MIELLLACTLLQAPLALTGDESGLWFIGDINPSTATFSGLPLDLDYELCERYSEKQYEVIRPFTRRPSAIAIDKETMWYIDSTAGIGLYKMQRSNTKGFANSHPALQPSTLEAIFESSSSPTDFLLFEGSPTLAFGTSKNGALELFQYSHRKWKSLPLLQGEHVHVAIMQEQLIAAVPNGGGVAMWYLKDGRWRGGDELAIHGELKELLCRDDWPILVTTLGEMATLSGIQQGGLVEIASFRIPKGRWGVASSSTGISVVGVERNGTTTVLDIGWPSGSISSPIIFEEYLRKDGSMMMTVLFISMLAVSLILVLKIRKPVQKTPK